MIVTQNRTRLYLKNWEYNACRITSALADVVENHGGQVKPHHTAIISNRTLDDAKRDISEKLTRFEALQNEEYNEKRARYIVEKTAELEKLNAINNEPIEVTHTTWITFVLDGMHYFYSMDDNPFFEFHYSKTPVRSGKYSLDAISGQDPKEWMYDCFFRYSASDADIIEAANIIFNMLVNAKTSPIHRDSRKTRVPNMYDGGYHYETVYEPERFGKLGEWYKEEK